MVQVIVKGLKQHELVYSERPKYGDNQVLVKVEACGICMSDVEIVDGSMPEPFVKYPCVPGHEFCGSVEEVGKNITKLAKGDRVSVECVKYCGKCFYCQKGQTHLCVAYDEMGFTLPGGYADFVEVDEDKAHKFSQELDFELAALAEPAAVAGHAITRANVHQGDTVVVLGPGTVGLLCVAWAALRKPTNLVVIGIDRFNENRSKICGATHYITVNEDPQSLLKSLTNGRGADVVIEAAGSTKAVELGMELARRGGKICLVGINGSTAPTKFSSDFFCLNDLTVEGVFSYPTRSFTEALRAIESGALPINKEHFISHRFKLSEYEAALDVLRKKSEPTLKILLLPSSQ